MPRSIIRTITTAIAIAAIAAPTALAQPADTPPAVAKAAAAAEQTQDARSPDARVGMYTPGATPAVTYTSGTNARSAAIDGYSQRPMSDQPPAPPISRPDTTPTAAADSGIAWTTIGLGIAGSLLAIAAIAAITTRTRRTGRGRITA